MIDARFCAATRLPGVFPGDIMCGASLVVRAIRGGRDVAASMHKWLKAQSEAGGVMVARCAIILACAVASASPVVAQTAAPPAGMAAADADPARLKEATSVVDRLWPLGTYRRLMDGTMSKLIDTMMDQMYALKPSDIVPTAKGEAPGAKGEATMGAQIAAEDPYFRERTRLGTKAMFDAMLPMMDKIEPTVRASMTRIYARKFSADDLRAMDAFFATPAGQAYAREWMLSFMDPEIMKGMQSFVPELMKEMPAIMKKVEAATAHLPPAKKKATP